MKSAKKILAAILAVMHVLTYSATAQQVINVTEGTTTQVDSVQVNAGEQLTINVLNQLGEVCPSCRGILETNGLLNNGAIDIWGILAIIAPSIINNGVITVQGDLLLSNLGIDKAAFFAGVAELSKDPTFANGYILNTGEIKNLTQGLIALVGANGGVHNFGTISSNGGVVALVAGEKVSFPLTRDGALNINIEEGVSVKGQVFDKDGNLVDTKGLITNSGLIQANGGAVVLQAAGAEKLYDSIINHTGIIEAKSVTQDETGKIILNGGNEGLIEIDGGVLDATGLSEGEKGGSIQVLTKGNIIVDGASVIDASGNAGGGEILIGGDAHGSGSINAANVGINSNVKVKADAIANGNGGKIIVWSEGATIAYGDFSAKGGAQFGNGGFIETSGNYVDLDGIAVDATAAYGEVGTWLLDPAFLVITGGTNDGNDNGVSTTLFGNNGSGDNGTITFANGTPTVIYESEIEGTNANLQLQATNGISVSGVFTGGILIVNNRNILIETRNSSGEGSTGIDLVAGATDFSITTQGTGTVTINSGTNGGDAGNAPINLSAITTGSGAITVNGEGTVTVNGALNTGNLLATGTTGAISLTSQNAGVVVNNTVKTGDSTVADNSGGQTARSGNITVSAGTSISGTGAITTGNAELTGSVFTGSDTAQSGNITLSSGTAGASGGIGLSNASALNIGSAQRTGIGAGTDTTTAGNINLDSRDEINNGTASTALQIAIAAASGGLTNNLGSLAVTTSQAAGNLFVSNALAGVLNLGALTTSGGSINVSSANGLNLTGNIRTDQGTNAGAVTLTGPVTLGANNLFIDTDAAAAGIDAAITLAGTLNSDATARNFELRAGGANVDFQNAVGATSELNNLTVTSGNQTTFSSTAKAQTFDLTSTTTRFTGDVTATADDVKVTGNAVLLGDVNFKTGQAGGDDFSVSGTTTASGGARNISVDAGTGGVDFGGAVTTSGGNFSSKGGGGFDNTGAAITTAGGKITLNHTGVLSIDAALNSGAGDIDIDAAGNVNVNAGLTTTSGNLTIDNSGSNNITVNNAINTGSGNVTLTSQAITTINNTVMSTSGDIALRGNTNVNLNNATADITTGGTYTAVADMDGNGTGAYQQQNAGSAVSANGISITGNDFQVTGTHNSGTGSTTILATDGATIGLGGTNKTMTITGAELQSLTANGLTIGDSTNGDITVDGITAANSNNIAGTTTLNASNASGVVNFSTGASTFNALAVNAGNGINVNKNITTDTGGIALNADSNDNGAGTLTVANITAINSGNQALQITADDLNLNATGTLNSGSADTTILTSTGNTIGLGATAGDMTISGAELENITANGLIVGGSNNGNVTVNGITAANSNNISGTTTLNANSAAGTVSFNVAASTFNTLAVNAGNGVTLNQNVTTDTGGIAVNADSDASGTGTFTIATGTTANTSGQDMSVTANDFVLTGTGAINAGSGDVSLLTSAASTTIGLGGGAGTFNVTDAEADKITTSELKIGAANSGNMTIDGFSPANTSKLTLTTGGSITEGAGAITTGDLKFTAGGTVTLDNTANTFNTVSGTTTSGAINVKDSGTNTEVKDLQTVGSTIDYEHTGAGDVTITGTISSGDGSTNGGNIEINSSNALTLNTGGLISSLAGTGGTVTLGSAVVNGTITAGAGNITLGGGVTALDLIINSAIISATSVVLTALRDIVLNTSITTTGTASVSLTADSDNDGVGGLWLNAAGSIDSAGDITLIGSSIFDGGAAGESIRIDADGSNNQILAAGNIILSQSGTAPVPATADITVNGIVKTTGGPGITISVNSNDQINSSDNGSAEFFAPNLFLTAKNGINVESDVTNISYSNSTSGNVAIEDMTGGLTIGGATNGGAGSTTILTHSPLTIAADMIQAGTINLTAGEAVVPAAGDNLTVGAFTVRSTAGDVNLSAGDNIDLQAGSTVQSTVGAVNVTAASGDNDDIGSVNLAGAVNAAATLTLTAITQVAGALGFISQTNGSVSAADLILNTDDTATLNQAANSVTTLAATTGGAVTYQDASGLDLKASTVGGALNLTTAGNITDSGNVAVTGTTTLTAGANDITLDNANDFSTVNVVSGKDVTIKDVNSLSLGNATLTGALSATADSDNNTVGSTLTTGTTSATSVSLSGGTDNDDVITMNGTTTATTGSVVVDHAATLNVNADVTAATLLTLQNAATVNLSDNTDLTANNGAVSVNTGVTAINLTGAVGTTNVVTSHGDQAITLGAVNSATNASLTVNSDGDVTLGNVSIGTGDLTVNVDNNDTVGGNTGTFNDLTVNNLSISGHNAASPDENFTFNGVINMSGDLDIGGVGVLTYNNDVTAKSITIHDISQRVQLGGNVDLTSTNGILSVVTNVVSILLAGANGTTNIFDGNGDAAVNLGPITATNNPNLTVNSEGEINVTSANIGTGTLTAAVDNDSDGSATATFGALTSGAANVGGSSNDNLVFNGAVITNTAGLTISNANDVGFNSTVNTATTLTQTAGSGTTTFNGNTATVGTDASITTGSIAFSGAGNVNANAGTGTVTLNAGTGNITSGTATADVIAGSLTTTAVTGIDLDTTITTLTNANVSGAGNIGVRDTAGGLAVTSATTNNGAITLNATGGNLDVTTATSGGGNDINLGTITSGNINVDNVTATGGNIVANSAGAIEELGADAGADLTASNLDLSAVSGIGAAGTIEIDATTLLNASVSGTGKIDLSDLTGGLAATSATTNDGAITINATGGNLDATTVTAGGTGKNINLSTTASGNVNVGNVTASGDDITVNSADKIEELGADAAADLTSNTMTLTAVNGIGKTAQLEIDATTLTSASTTGAAGTINLSDVAGGLAVTSATTTDGAITINATGGDLAATTVTAGGTGRDINLTTTTSGNITLGTITALNDTATITSAGTIGEIVNDDAGVQSVDVSAGTINLTTGGGDIGAPASYLDIEPTTLWNATSNGGGIYISCVGVCPMGKIDAGTGTFYYAGNITDGNDTVRGFFDDVTSTWKAIDSATAADWNIRAGGVHLDGGNTVAGFIGTSTNWIEMRLAGAGAALGKITAEAGTGGIHVSNDDTAAHPGLQIGGVTPVPAPNNLADGLVSTGGIEVYSFSPLVLAANVVDNSANSIDLVAAGNLAADDLTINTGVTVDQQGTGTVRMFAGDAINLNGTAVVQSTTGIVSANAGEDFTDLTVNQNGNSAGSIVMSSTSAFRSQSGDINLTANDHAQISEVNADSNATGPQGNVTIEADKNASGVGRIEDMNGASTNVTGNKLTMNAGSGIGVNGANVVDAIETSIVRLALTNSTSGHAAVTEVSTGGNMDIESATQNAASDDLSIRTTNGNLTVLDALSLGTGVSAKAGETSLEANGVTGDLIVNNTVTSTTGKINLDSTGQDVLFSADGDVTATGGAEIEVTALRDITMNAGTVLNANGGGTVGASAIGVGIDMIATNGSVTLGSVQTTSTASTSRGDANNAVTINALNGAVIDGGDTLDNIIANAGETVINAKDGIGQGNSIETQIDRLTATNSSTNDIDIRETIAGGALNIVRVFQQAATGRIDVQTLDGTLTVLTQGLLGAFSANGVEGLAGEIFLRANGAGSNDDLVLNNQIQSSTGKINLDSSSRDVIADAEGDVTATGGAEIESDSANNITMADGTVWNSNSGIIDLDATNDITIGSLQSTNATVNAVTVVSQNGQIIDGGDTNVDIQTGATGAAHLVAKTGIGSANGLETQIGQLAARTQAGNIQLFNTGDMTITSLTDADSSAQSTLNGGTTGGVQITDPTNLNTGANFIFVTNNGNLTVNNDVSNLDGGDVSLYSFGNVGAGNMNINANVESIGANGNMRIVSGGDMNMAAGTNVKTQGNGVASGTGLVAVAAGYDVSGKTRNPDMSVNPVFAADVLPGLNGTSLTTTSTNGVGSLLDTLKDASASLTMNETSRISTEGGNIIVDAQNNFTVGRVDADGNAGANGITDGVRGNILAFARNGSILDAEGPGEVGNLDFVAKSLTMLAGQSIGLPTNHIEGDAPLLNTFSVGSQFVDMQGNTQVEMNSANGSIFLTATGTILLGHMSAPSGEVHAKAGGDILSQGGPETRVTASNLIELIANGIIGTTSNPIHTQLNANPAQLSLSAGGQAPNGVSIAVTSNVSNAAVNMLNNPPGLVLFNNLPIAGATLPGLIGSQAALYYKALVRGLRQYSDIDGTYAADYPGFNNYENLAYSPDISVDTSALDIPVRGLTTAPRVVPLPKPAVPTPVQPSQIVEQPPVLAQEPTPPAVVSIPAKATPSTESKTNEGVPETPTASN